MNKIICWLKTHHMIQKHLNGFKPAVYILRFLNYTLTLTWVILTELAAMMYMYFPQNWQKDKGTLQNQIPQSTCGYK